MFNIVNNLWSSYKRKTCKTRMEHRLGALEQHLTHIGEWRSDLNTLIGILECIDDYVLESAPLKKASDYTIFTGFHNAKHVMDWAATVRNSIHNGTLLGEETKDIVYTRKNRILHGFITSGGKVETTIVGFKQQLLQALIDIRIEVEAISDNRTRHREQTVINSAIRDLFAVVETIIAWGMTDE